MNEINENENGKTKKSYEDDEDDNADDDDDDRMKETRSEMESFQVKLNLHEMSIDFKYCTYCGHSQFDCIHHGYSKRLRACVCVNEKIDFKYLE